IELRRRGRRGRVAEGSREDGPGPRAATDLAGPYLPVIAPAILQRRRGRGRGTRLAGDVGHPRERLLRRPELDLRLQHRIVMRAAQRSVQLELALVRPRAGRDLLASGR